MANKLFVLLSLASLLEKMFSQDLSYTPRALEMLRNGRQGSEQGRHTLTGGDAGR